MARDTVYRSLHDVGLATWFGGSLMGVVGLNPAAERADRQARTAEISSVGWAQWAPVNAVAIAAHLIGGAGILAANRKRAQVQKGVRANTVAKLVVTGAALAATAYSGVLGAKVAADVAGLGPNAGPDVAGHDTGTGLRFDGGQPRTPGHGEHEQQRLPGDADSAQRQLTVVQWVIPVLTGTLEVLNAQQGEQQRPGDQVRGITARAAERLVGRAA